MKTYKLITILSLTAVLITPINGKVFESVSLETWKFESCHLHPSNVKAGSIKSANPGIIVFTPTATDTEGIKMGFFKKRKHNKGIEKIL